MIRQSHRNRTLLGQADADRGLQQQRAQLAGAGAARPAARCSAGLPAPRGTRPCRTAAGNRLSHGFWLPGSTPSHSRKPADDQRQHVDRGGQQEQDRRALRDRGRVPAALDQQQAADRDAADAAQRYRRVERQLGQRDPRPETDRRALEHLQEREDVAGAGEDLEHDRHDHPAELHPRHRVGDALQAGHREQQPDRERDQAPSQIRLRHRLLPAAASCSAAARSSAAIASASRSSSAGGASSAVSAMVDYSSSDAGRNFQSTKSSGSARLTRVRSRSAAPTPGSSASTRRGLSIRGRRFPSTIKRSSPSPSAAAAWAGSR